MKTRRGLRRRAGIAATMAGVAVMVGGAVAQPAAATEMRPPWGQANFYTGSDFTGTVYPIPALGTPAPYSPSECVKLPEPMKSIANFKYAYVQPFEDENCTDSPGLVTGLHWGNLSTPARSYKVLVTLPPANYPG
ncbi:hypothetical protein AB0L10_40235 [Streptomyces flaveolus]|uniref:hypothetical protein n=1 Tax=Streptomyces flaveolus TaxID=67297 RepID=UPI0034294138